MATLGSRAASTALILLAGAANFAAGSRILSLSAVETFPATFAPRKQAFSALCSWLAHYGGRCGSAQLACDEEKGCHLEASKPIANGTEVFFLPWNATLRWLSIEAMDGIGEILSSGYGGWPTIPTQDYIERQRRTTGNPEAFRWAEGAYRHNVPLLSEALEWRERWIQDYKSKFFDVAFTLFLHHEAFFEGQRNSSFWPWLATLPPPPLEALEAGQQWPGAVSMAATNWTGADLFPFPSLLEVDLRDEAARGVVIDEDGGQEQEEPTHLKLALMLKEVGPELLAIRLGAFNSIESYVQDVMCRFPQVYGRSRDCLLPCSKKSDGSRVSKGAPEHCEDLLERAQQAMELMELRMARADDKADAEGVNKNEALVALGAQIPVTDETHRRWKLQLQWAVDVARTRIHDFMQEGAVNPDTMPLNWEPDEDGKTMNPKRWGTSLGVPKGKRSGIAGFLPLIDLMNHRRNAGSVGLTSKTKWLKVPHVIKARRDAEEQKRKKTGLPPKWIPPEKRALMDDDDAPVSVSGLSATLSRAGKGKERGEEIFIISHPMPPRACVGSILARYGYSPFETPADDCASVQFRASLDPNTKHGLAGIAFALLNGLTTVEQVESVTASTATAVSTELAAPSNFNADPPENPADPPPDPHAFDKMMESQSRAYDEDDETPLKTAPFLSSANAILASFLEEELRSGDGSGDSSNSNSDDTTAEVLSSNNNDVLEVEIEADGTATTTSAKRKQQLATIAALKKSSPKLNHVTLSAQLYLLNDYAKLPHEAMVFGRLLAGVSDEDAAVCAKAFATLINLETKSVMIDNQRKQAAANGEDEYGGLSPSRYLRREKRRKKTLRKLRKRVNRSCDLLKYTPKGSIRNSDDQTFLAYRSAASVILETLRGREKLEQEWLVGLGGRPGAEDKLGLGPAYKATDELSLPPSPLHIHCAHFRQTFSAWQEINKRLTHSDTSSSGSGIDSDGVIVREPFFDEDVCQVINVLRASVRALAFARDEIKRAVVVLEPGDPATLKGIASLKAEIDDYERSTQQMLKDFVKEIEQRVEKRAALEAAGAGPEECAEIPPHLLGHEQGTAQGTMLPHAASDGSATASGTPLPRQPQPVKPAAPQPQVRVPAPEPEPELDEGHDEL